MKKIVRIDYCMQILIIVTALIFLVIDGYQYVSFLMFYFGLGAWQLLSFFVHLKRRIKNQRLIRLYAKSILWTLIIGVMCVSVLFVHEAGYIFLIMYLYFMLIVGIVLAFVYLNLTRKDISLLKLESL